MLMGIMMVILKWLGVMVMKIFDGCGGERKLTDDEADDGHDDFDDGAVVDGIVIYSSLKDTKVQYYI